MSALFQLLIASNWGKQMIVIKNKVALEKMRIAGRILAPIVHQAGALLQPGMSTLEIDSFVTKTMRAEGLKPECIGYGTYKHATCISVNDVIVHGVPSAEVILKPGDFVKIDVVGSYKGYCADMARFFFIGSVDAEVKRLAAVAQRSLDKAIALAVPGAHLHDLSFCIQEEVEREGFGIVRDFAGHGIGKDMHEDPEVPNFGKPGTGPILREGMTLAIEPMITQGSPKVKIMPDGWTAKTADGGIAAHVEDTVLVSSHGPEILTRPE